MQALPLRQTRLDRGPLARELGQRLRLRGSSGGESTSRLAMRLGSAFTCPNDAGVLVGYGGLPPRTCELPRLPGKVLLQLAEARLRAGKRAFERGDFSAKTADLAFDDVDPLALRRDVSRGGLLGARGAVAARRQR